MAMHLFCYCSIDLAKVEEVLSSVKSQYKDLFTEKFLISTVGPSDAVHVEILHDHGLYPKCLFLIRLNDKSVAYRYHEAVVIIKAALGDANVVILFEGETRC